MKKTIRIKPEAIERYEGLEIGKSYEVTAEEHFGYFIKKYEKIVLKSDVEDQGAKTMKFSNERLKQKRIEAGLSQSGLANQSGVSLRMIQYYEQGRDDINKAQAGTVYRLAIALDCTVEEIIEPERLTD